MPKTLFLNPPSFSRFDSAGARFAATRKTHSLWYPVWLGYGAALVPNSKLIDSPAKGLTLPDLLKNIRSYDLIVIYTSTQSFENDVLVAEAIKNKHPRLKIIFAGPHVSVLPKNSLQASKAIDGVAIKEFEQTILEISRKKPWSKIKGLAYRKRNKVIINPPRPGVKNLDSLPFISKIYKRDLPLYSYHLPFCLHPYIAIYAGRGCPNQCTFCLWPQTFTGRIYRKRSVANVIQELLWIKRNLPFIKEVFFDDDTFTVNHRWVHDFCQKVTPLNLTWSVNARADLPFDLLEEMKKAGCRLLVVGFESGDSKILENIKKGVNLNQMRRFAKDAHKAGLMIHATFILGLPGETPTTMAKTYKLACDLDPETIQISLATPLPGTELNRFCRQNGFLKKASLVNQTGYQSAIISYPHLSADKIRQSVEKFHLKFYFRPSYVLKLGKIALSSPAEAQRIFHSAKEYALYLIKSIS